MKKKARMMSAEPKSDELDVTAAVNQVGEFVLTLVLFSVAIGCLMVIQSWDAPTTIPRIAVALVLTFCALLGGVCALGAVLHGLLTSCLIGSDRHTWIGWTYAAALLASAWAIYQTLV